MTRRLSLPNASAQRMAEALAQAKVMGGQEGEQGLESPLGQKLLENAGIAAGGYGAGQMGGTIANLLASRGVPAMQALGEAGAIFPKETPPEALPIVPPGAKTGDPHALFAYKDHPDFGGKSMYNIFGDPKNPIIKQVGHGSSVTADTLEKYGIPIVGREPPRSFAQKGFH